MKIKSDIGSRIKRERNKKGLTQDQLAALMGVKRQTISSWEVGRTEPDLAETIDLCDILECSLTEFVSDYAARVQTISLYNELTEPNRILVDDFVKMLHDKQLEAGSVAT